MKKFKLAICQNKPGFDKEKNVAGAIKMIETAARNRAELITLPEIFYYPYELASIRKIAETKNGPTLSALKDCAKRCKVYLCTGSIAEKSRHIPRSVRFPSKKTTEDSFAGEKPRLKHRNTTKLKKEIITNTSYLIDPQGKVLLKHDKCHMFDVSLDKLKCYESALFRPGKKIALADTPLGKIGILICYDIRFPEAARKLALMNMDILLVPAAFNSITGPAHWQTIFRARAIENQVFVAAASPALNPKAVYKAYGHSMIISPWGDILTETGQKEDIIYADIDPQTLKDTRRKLPLLKHRRGNLYK